jgi:hypothetical protein
MKKWIIAGSVLLAMAGMFSCQKNGSTNSGSLTTNLYTATAELVGNAITKSTTADEHSVAVEKFDGTSPAFLAGSDGSHLGLDFHGWNGHLGPLCFGVPHIDSCVTVTVSDSTYPKEIVIEFLQGCDMHRHDRHGKIIINLSDTITNAGALETITYQDFYIDSVKVDMTATLENKGKNDSGNWVIEKTSSQTINRNNETVVRTNHEMFEWIGGFETADRQDNVYYISGSGSVTINDTARYSKTITTPLLFDASCDFIKSGVIELNRGGSVSVIDFGDGTCDDKATITIDGTTEEINLHSNRFKEGGEFRKHCDGFGHGFHH